MTEICQTLLLVSAAYGQGWTRGGRIRVMILPPAIFNNAFDIHNFFIISNLFDSNKPYTLSTHNRKCANKMYHIFGEALGIGVKKLNLICMKIIQKSTKIAIAACKFSKFFGGACPRTPLELFLFLNQLRICSAEKKYA